MTRHNQIALAFVNALSWRIFHTFGLGLALKYQSEKKWIVRHFLKHYHYEADGEPVQDAFSNWKATYNLSLCMSYGKFETRAPLPFLVVETNLDSLRQLHSAPWPGSVILSRKTGLLALSLCDTRWAW